MTSIFRRCASAVSLLVAISFGTNAFADDKRPDPDYGHPKESTDVGDVVAWPVRVVLFPLWLVNEFILRRPIGWLVVTAEKHNVVEAVQDFFTFGPRNEVTIYPSALFDFGLLPSVGFNLAWSHFVAEKNTFRLHFGTWGPDWLMIRGSSTYEFSKREKVSFEAGFFRRSDNPFFGLGPKSKQGAETRFGEQSYEFAPSYTNNYWRSSVFSSTAGIRGVDFFHGTCCSDPSLDSAIATNKLPTPTGYEESYWGGFQRASVSLDTREARPAPGSGFRVEAHEETLFDVTSHPGLEKRSFIKWGGSIGGVIDVTGHQRNLGISLHTDFADPLQGKVPFTDQVTLGGDDLMPGYIRYRLIDRSALVGRVQYTWPVWMYLDGIITASIGNVWGEHLDNFKIQDSRVNAGIGVRSNGDRASGFELLVGAGSDPIADGFNVSSFRFLIGSHHGL